MENEYGHGAAPPLSPGGPTPKRARGGQPGNRNALKTGRHTAGARAGRKRRLSLARDIRALLYYLRARAD